jgi:lipopolysaccharide export system permease protein
MVGAMNRIDRYVIRHIMELTGLVALGLLAIYTFVAFVADINDTGKGGYGVPQLAAYTALNVPSSLYILMPIVALLGTMLGIGALARSSELTAMRAAGVSLTRIGVATLAAGLALGVFTVILGDWLAPSGERIANDLRDRARGMPTSRTIWLRDGQSMVQIRRLVAEDHMLDVAIFQLASDGRVENVLTAREGQYREEHWHLTDVRQTHFTPDRTEVTTASDLDWSGGVSPTVLRLFILEADSLSFRGLLRLMGYLHDNRLDFSKYELLFWRKLVEPLTVMAMMVFAIPFVLGRSRDSGAGQRLLLGVLIGIVFYVANKMSVSYGALYEWPAPLAAGMPTAILALFAGWRLTRAE